jgi:F0F1-type ATP synthase assembly protein I
VATTDTAEHRLTALRDRLQDLDLRERLEELDLRERFEDVREHAEEVREEVAARAANARDDARERVPALLEDLEPASRQARIRGWELVRWVVGVVLIVPRLLVRLLGNLPDTVERTAEHGTDLADRARHAAASVPTVRRARRRRRTQLAAWTAGGFVAGALVGWLLGRRTTPEVSYEATQGDTLAPPAPAVNGAAPVTADPAVRE